MRNNLFTALAFFAVACGAGVFFAKESWRGVVYVSTDTFSSGHARTPAAIRRDLDFSRLDGAELITASQKRLVTAARIILQGQSDDVGVELGHFVTRGDEGQRQLACDFYDHLELRFEAEGIADSGDKPVMEIEGPCQTANDITRIEPIWIPVARIMGERPSNMDLSYPDRGDVSFRFDHMGTEWPTRWNLQSVRLYSEDEKGREVSISGRELREILARPIVVTWPRVQ